MLELPDLLDDTSFYERRVPLKRLLQGAGRDVFLHAVYPVRDFSLSGRPDRSELLVCLPPHQECVRHEYKLIPVFLNIRDLKLKDLLPEIHIFPAHGSIHGHFSFYNDFSHLRIVGSGGGAVLYKNDSCRVPRAISVGVCPIRYLRDRVR